MNNQVWIVMDSDCAGGESSVKGVFKSKEDAKLFVADYVLENHMNTEYLELFAVEVL